MKTQFIASYCIRALVLGLIGIGTVVPVHADFPFGNPDVYPRDFVVFGRTYSEWSAAWWQWAYSLSASKHPLFDTAECPEGQSGPVWFLGGRFCNSNDTSCNPALVVRSCTVPHGKALYFPIINFACLDIEAQQGLCGSNVGPFITQMRAYIGDGIDPITNLQVIVDGRPTIGNLKNAFRVQSPVFTAVLPDGNLLQAIGETAINAGTYWGVDDGVYIMLQPLPRGVHTLKFTGTVPQPSFTLDVTYHLTVQ